LAAQAMKLKRFAAFSGRTGAARAAAPSEAKRLARRGLQTDEAMPHVPLDIRLALPCFQGPASLPDRGLVFRHGHPVPVAGVARRAFPSLRVSLLEQADPFGPTERFLPLLRPFVVLPVLAGTTCGPDRLGDRFIIYLFQRGVVRRRDEGQ